MKRLYFLLSICLFFSITSFSQISSVAPGGNWSDPATWDGGNVPTSADNVIITDGSTVVIDADGNAKSLVVDQNAVLEYEAVIARKLNVKGDVTINQGGTFRSSLTGNQYRHTLSLTGNLTNNGDLDFSTSSNFAGASIGFSGNGNATFTGSGTTDILRITINKGTDISSGVEIAPDNLTFMDSVHRSAIDPGFLNMLNGMCKLSGNYTLQCGLFANSLSYTIPSTAGVWFNNPNLTVLPRSGTAYVEGTLIMDAGTLNIGTDADNRLGYILGTKITINGGAINVSGRFSATSTYGVVYTQTGGTLTLNTVGSTSNSYACFDMKAFDNSTFNMSGGTIVIQNAGSGTAGPRDYYNFAENINITGGSLVFGNSSSPANQTFYAAGTAPQLELNGDNGGNTLRLSGDLNVLYNTTIGSGCVLKLDDGSTGRVYTANGTSFINNGDIDGSASGSELYFPSQSSAHTMSGTGVISSVLNNLRMENPQGLVISTTTPSEIVANIITMNGDINTGVNTLTLGTGATSLGTFNHITGTIIGRFKRWIATSTGSTDFPVGVVGYQRNANIDFTAAPSSAGTLTAEWVSSPGGSLGLSLIEGSNVITTSSSEGFWRISAGDGFTGGTYTGTFNADGLSTITDYSQLVLLKREEAAGSPWTLDGVHVPTTGSNSAAVLSRTDMSGFSEFGIGGSITSLPIAIEYFKGSKRTNSNNSLDWKINCTGSTSATITLERSNNSRTYSTVTTMNATSLRCLQPFNYADNNVTDGVNYYRLKVTDADGKSIYSNVIALNNNSSAFELAGISPNPVLNRANLSIASSSNTQIELMVSDMNGRKLKRSVVTVFSGSNNISLDFSDLPAGSYQMTGVTKEGFTKTIQFIKK